MEDDRWERLRDIRDAVVKLSHSPLYDYRKENNYFPVIGQGDHYARVMFIGEAPGRREAEIARPFVGAAGKFLDEMLTSIGVRREDVYITNIVKDRPPENRDPTFDEIRLYAPFLLEQIEIIQPEVIVTLGRFSMEFILHQFNRPEYTRSISTLHGKVFPAKTSYGEISIVVLYHPAMGLHKAEMRPVLLKDFQVLKQFFE